MRSKFAGPLVVACAAIALGVVGYRQMTSKPVLHDVTPASCSPEAIKNIANITERAIQSSKCAQSVK
jgi:hypothetical protein